MVAERYGLGALEMGVARHGVGGMRQREVAERLYERLRAGGGELALLAHDHAVEQRHLVVARAGRVEATRGRADLLAQENLDVGVDILELGAPLDLTGAEAFEHTGEPGDDRLRLAPGDDAGRPEHARVRDRARDVVLVQVTVDPRGVIAREVVHGPLEAATPGALCFAHGSILPRGQAVSQHSGHGVRIGAG